MDSSHLLLRMKHFVKSSGSPTTSTIVADTQHQIPKTAFVCGNNVKQFYENIVGTKELEKTHKTKLKEQRITQKEKSDKEEIVKIPLNVNALMKAVESGSTKRVEEMLKSMGDCVDCKDQFGWTPMMCACCSGNRAMVQVLLQWRPDLSVRDRRGLTCWDLARTGGHHSIVDLLDQFTRGTLHNPPKQAVPNNSPTTIFYCQVCKQNIESTTLKKHLSSTVHNFHSASKRKMPTFYGIPESNRGFQILVKSGWNKEDGLGPSGEGHKYPPKTVLKQDRTGLGAKKYKARVTHSVDVKQARVKQKNVFKRDLKSEKRIEQRLERNLRNMLS